jgi:hypothetical protein
VVNHSGDQSAARTGWGEDVVLSAAQESRPPTPSGISSRPPFSDAITLRRDDEGLEESQSEISPTDWKITKLAETAQNKTWPKI